MDELLAFLGRHPFLTVALVGVVAMLLLNEWQLRTRKWKEIGPAAAARLLSQDNTLLLDVRDTREFEEGHILNARLFPVAEFKDRLTELAADPDRPVLVYCASGARSATACNRLVAAGLTDVNNLAGGIMAWRNERLPVVKGRDKPARKDKAKPAKDASRGRSGSTS